MAKKPPACRHSTSMIPPMKLDMSNLAWENSGDELVLRPSPGGKEEKQFDGLTGKLHESRMGKEESGVFFPGKHWEGFLLVEMTEWHRGTFYSALMGIINV